MAFDAQKHFRFFSPSLDFQANRNIVYNSSKLEKRRRSCRSPEEYECIHTPAWLNRGGTFEPCLGCSTESPGK
ncbi:hypothetical protein AMECASPLE_002421 [Ameca splendens]|uniref:Uncharacterized protein n=1 Tax=Ameca splendens TaxID=208324 RepID=A0ABV0ZW90_9TELE